jgi:hypothetical protein
VQEPFRLGRVIARSFSIWRRNLVLLFALVLVVSLPRILFAVYQELVPPDPPTLPDPFPDSILRWAAPYLLRHTGLQLLRSLFIHLSQAVVIFAVYHRLRGEAATFRDSLRGGLRRFLPVVLVAVTLFVLGTLIWAAYLILLSEAKLYVLFYGFYFVPVLLLLLLSPFWVAVPAAVVERSRNFLKRSWILTRGHRLRVFAILLILYAIDWGMLRLYILVEPELPRPVAMTAWWIQDLLLVALAAVLAVVGYRALRLEKDGVDVSDLEEVFA